VIDIRDSAGGRYTVAVRRAPASEDRLAFLRTLQRVLKEGDFTATYKFALLRALLDIAVESRVRDGSELPVSYRQLADKFIEYYWGHAEPYRPGPDGGGVLAQSPGRQAAVITAISSARSRNGARSLAQLRRDGTYSRLQAEVVQVIRAQPVKYIQNLNGGRVEFLFRRAAGGNGIVLHEGVAWCLQEFYDLLQSQLRIRWVEQIRSISRNASLIGGHRDLEDFLFGQQRVSLYQVRERLLDLDGNHCFYCERSIRGEAQVDHFVPWARYQHDRGHNFVLTDASCNHSKRDSLAGKRYLEKWLYRLDGKSALISDALADLMLCDVENSRKVAQWAYLYELDSDGVFWAGLRGREAAYEHGDDEIRRLVLRESFAG